jgi:hypothetical protein
MAKKRGKKFHQFSRLPPELRTRIWEMTEAEPRIVDVSTRPPGRIQGHYQYVKSSTRPPAVLHACSEARRCALARSLYVKAFTDGSQPRYTWVNFEKDMIAVEPIYFDPIMSEKALIQRLRMTGHMDDEVFYHKSCHQMREFVNIKEVHVICADNIESWRQAVDEMYFGTYNVKFFHKTPEGRMLDWEGMKAAFPSTWT